jgi:sigma-B regulation protein RsbU (phosphoserine phosphatase)
MRRADSDRERLIAVQRDLQTAAEIQRSFLPPPFPQGRQDCQLCAAMQPARDVGGDFYDYFFLDRDRLGVVVGDVSGKGVTAALFMAVSRTLTRTIALAGTPPGQCLEEVNRQLLQHCGGASSMFVTMFYCILNLKSGELKYANGGHLPPYLLRPGTAPTPLQGNGRLVGALDEAAYRSYRCHLQPGDVLFLYSDGITEARNAADDLFTTRRLEQTLARGEPSSAEGVVGNVLDAVTAFAAGVPQSDDVTAVALRYAP